MPISRNTEPGAISGQEEAQQQQSINFSTTIPIKKRRFPAFQSFSPPRVEKHSVLENKEESNIDDGGVSSSETRNTASLLNPDLARTSIVAVKKEVVPTITPLTQANVDILGSVPEEAKPKISLGPLDDVGNRKVILQDEKSSEPEIPDRSMVAQTADVKRKFICGQTESTCSLQSKLNVELSLGPKESVVSALENQQNEAISHKSTKSDSLLSLALHKGKNVLCDKKDSAMNTVSNPVCANRSNWDLNTTMDVWEGSTNSDTFANGLVNTGEFSKTDSCHNGRSVLTIASTTFPSSDKGKLVLDGHMSSSSKPSAQLCKTGDSLGLRLAVSYMNASTERSSLSDNLECTGVTPSLKHVQLPVVDAGRTVKPEPVDDNSKHDSSIGSCNMESLKRSFVKSECASNQGFETILQSPISLEKLDDLRSVKSEVVSVAKIMQHQESSASSSALPVPLLPQGPSPSRLPTCSELTTTEEFSSQSVQCFHSKSQRNDIPDELTATHNSRDNDLSRPCKIEISSVVDQGKSDLPQIEEHTVDFCLNDALAANVEGKVHISSEMLEDEEDSFGSDSESQKFFAVDTVCRKEDEEYEDGEVREHVQSLAEGEPIIEGKNADNLELVKSDPQNLQSSVPSTNQNISAFVSNEKDIVKKDLDETHADPITDYGGACYEPNSECNTLLESCEVSDFVPDEKKIIGVLDKQLDPSAGDTNECSKKEISLNIPTDGSHGNAAEISGEATPKVYGDDDLTVPKVDTSPNANDIDVTKDSNNAGNKSRIITLSRPPVLTPPFKTKSFSNRLVTSRSGKERYSDFDGEFQPRGNRDEFHMGNSNKFVKDRVHDQSIRNSRPSFMRGRGRSSGRFGSLRGEWDPDHDFASESSYGPSDYRVIRRKHASSISNVDMERNDYNNPQDGTAVGGNRRKAMNDEFPTLRRTSLRRLSSGGRGGPATRGYQMLHRVPRNISPRRPTGETDSDIIGLRNDDKFMQHLSDDIINPGYSHPQAMYDGLDSQLLRGNRNFSTNLHRKGYSRIHSKSPVRSRTRSPGPWSSPRRRSPNGGPELAQHRSPTMYRMGRMRSPDQGCLHDEIVARRRGSPSYVARHNMQHNNDLRDADSGIHPRTSDSIRRSSPGRGFPRICRTDALDSRELGDGDEYLNGPSLSNKFHELRGDGSSIDDRRKFIERRGSLRSYRPSYNTDNENFRFHLNDGPKAYRFCPEADTEFVARSDTRERDFDGRIKHQPMAVSRRARNIEEQQDGSYRPVERVWHDEGFTDDRMKRRRF